MQVLVDTDCCDAKTWPGKRPVAPDCVRGEGQKVQPLTHLDRPVGACP